MLIHQSNDPVSVLLPPIKFIACPHCGPDSGASSQRAVNSIQNLSHEHLMLPTLQPLPDRPTARTTFDADQLGRLSGHPSPERLAFRIRRRQILTRRQVLGALVTFPLVPGIEPGVASRAVSLHQLPRPATWPSSDHFGSSEDLWIVFKASCRTQGRQDFVSSSIRVASAANSTILNSVRSIKAGEYCVDVSHWLWYADTRFLLLNQMGDQWRQP